MFIALSPIVEGRVYPEVLPDDPVYPCIRYTVSTTPQNTLCGQSELSQIRYSVHVFAVTVAQAIHLVAALQGIMRGFEFENVPVAWQDGYEPNVRKHFQSVDFDVWEREQ
jgi:hypothetical protein